MSDAWDAAVARFNRAARVGFAVDGEPPFGTGYTAREGSHDDGPYAGPFLGGIGAPAFSRDILGRFDRWHFEPGVHVHQPIDAAFLAVRWSQGGRSESRKLRVGTDGFGAAQRAYAALFPWSGERYRGLPFDLLLECWSPTLSGDLATATLPLTFFTLHVDAVPADIEKLTAALFWPNLLGWTPAAQSSEHRTGRLWPAHTNAGNHAAPIDRDNLTGVAFRRARAGPETPASLAETIVVAAGTASRELTFLAEAATTGVPPAQQRFTIDYVFDRFTRTGELPHEERSWRAHWHEPQGAALAVPLAGPRAAARFVIAHDWPIVAFGAGRRWRRAYADDARRGPALAAHALERHDEWLRAIDAWHAETITAFTADGFAPTIAGVALNELSFVVGGGSFWGSPEAEPAAPDIVFRQRRHFGLLEGFDTGYHLYNTADLWVYAFSALTRHWPELADSVFDDYLDTIAIEGGGDRPTYRYGAVAPLHVAGKIPHDLGSPADDPWVRLNGYAMRDDPNRWKDHNPAFVLAFLLHARWTGRAIDNRTWRRLTAAAAFVAAQIDGPGGVPRHDEFGDSTWDNLAMQGYSSYAASLCAGMWAALAAEATRRGAADDAAAFGARGAAARATLDGLWNGEYFLANDAGKYGDAIMADALYGLYYAALLGCGDLVDSDRVSSHLRAVRRHGFVETDDDVIGPLLVSAPGKRQFAHDGGQSLQVNEVLIGAAWMYVVLARHWSLPREAASTADALRTLTYRTSGLQFRTPAAVDALSHFRAPLNMRPLSIWLSQFAGAAPRPPEGI